MTYEIGTRFGKLTVIGRTDKKLQVQCTCGKILTYSSSGLIIKMNRYQDNLDLVTCQTCTKKHSREVQANNPTYKAAQIANSYKTTAKHRGIDYKLSIDDIEKLIFNPCFYCGRPPSNNHTPKKGGMVSLHIMELIE